MIAGGEGQPGLRDLVLNINLLTPVVIAIGLGSLHQYCQHIEVFLCRFRITDARGAQRTCKMGHGLGVRGGFCRVDGKAGRACKIFPLQRITGRNGGNGKSACLGSANRSYIDLFGQ